MNILAVSTWFPYPPDNGSKMRTYHLLRYLGERHRLDLLALRQSDGDLRHVDEVRKFCRQVSTHPEPQFRPSGVGALLAFLSPVPRYFRAHHSPGLEAELREWVRNERYDAILAVTLGAAPYVAALPYGLDGRARLRPSHSPSGSDGASPSQTTCRKVLDEHNVESQVIRRQAREKRSPWKRFRLIPTWVKAERYERLLAARFDAVSVVSEQERALFRALTRNGRTPAMVIPNGIDPGLLDFNGVPRENNLLAFTGALSYGPNRDAALCLCREVLPLVQRHVPEARVRITGRASDADRKLFGASNMMVELTGYVDDVQPMIASASALVAPLRFGGGTRLKILEAMGLGTPVVTTPVGAEGIDVSNGREILLGETAEEIADAAVRLLTDPEFSSEIARNARELVRKRYQWPAIAADFERMVTGQAQ